MNINNNIKIQREQSIININDKINYIDYIAWINLDRSHSRYQKMIELLKYLNIKNSKISAIDGKTEDLNEYKKNNNMTNYEIACCLSHIKAISYLKDIDGNYFMICEDDINFNNVKYFTINLEKIIKDAPKDFDILIINKTSYFIYDNIYTLLNSKLQKTWGAVCYIITKNAINKFNNIALYENNKFKINKNLEVSDIFIYKYLNTYVYKYNFIATNDEDSEIHSYHLDFHRNCSNIALNNILNNLETI